MKKYLIVPFRVLCKYKSVTDNGQSINPCDRCSVFMKKLLKSIFNSLKLMIGRPKCKN